MTTAKEIARQRRAELFQEHIFKIPLHGYEDVYAVQYRGLSFEELREIGLKNEKGGFTGAEKELVDSTDTLISACVGFVDLTSSEDLTERRWTPGTARDLFDAELPEGASARAAVRSVLPSLTLMQHFAAYDEKLSNTTSTVDAAAAGESEAA